MSAIPDREAIIPAASNGMRLCDIATTFRISIGEVNRIIDEEAERAFGGRRCVAMSISEKPG